MTNQPIGHTQPNPAAQQFFSQGLDHHDRGEFDAAITAYQQAIDADSNFVVAHNNLGMVYIDREMFSEAIDALTRTVQLDPGYAEAYNNLGFIHRRLGNDVEAAANYAEFVRLEPDVEDAARIAGWIETVKQQYGELPPPAAGAGQLGMPAAAAEVPDIQQTIMYGTEALGPGPEAVPAQDQPASSPEIDAEQGIAAFEAGDLASAEAWLKQALASNPSLAVARSALGRVLAKAERFAEAETELTYAVQLDPSDASAYYVLGFTLRSLGRDTEAAGAYERYLQLVPDAPDGPQIMEWMQQLNAAAGDMTPEEMYASASQAYADGQVDEASHLLENVLSIDAQNNEANVLLGRILVEKGDYLRAVPVLKRATTTSVDKAEVYYYLAQAYERRGLDDEALGAYTQCIEEDATGPYAGAAQSYIESASKSADSSVEAICDYCFRSFPENALDSHENKRICGDCQESLGLVSSAPATSHAPVVQDQIVERAAAIDTTEREKASAGARILSKVLIGVLSLLLIFVLLILGLRWGTTNPLMEKIGLHWVVRKIGLQDSFKAFGISIADAPDNKATKIENTKAVNKRPKVQYKKLLATGPKQAVDLAPLEQFEFKIKSTGGKGKHTYKLVSGPKGLLVDEKTGEITFDALPESMNIAAPLKHKVSIEVADSRKGNKRATTLVEFDINIGINFNIGKKIKTGAPVLAPILIASGNLNASRKEQVDDIAIAWGRYRTGSMRFFYRLGNRFAPGPPIVISGAPTDLAITDFTGDGKSDVVIANWFKSELHVFRQDESFVEDTTQVTGKGISDIYIADLNNDNHPDIVAAHSSEPIINTFLQSEDDDKNWKLGVASSHKVVGSRGQNFVFVSKLGSDIKSVVQLSRNSRGPLAWIFPLGNDGVLGSPLTSSMPTELPARPSLMRLIKTTDSELIAAILSGASSELYLLGLRDDNIVIMGKPSIELPAFIVDMATRDINGDGFDDIAVLSPDKINIYLAAEGGSFYKAGELKIPEATGPLVWGEFTGDGLADLLVGLGTAELQFIEISRGAAK